MDSSYHRLDFASPQQHPRHCPRRCERVHQHHFDAPAHSAWFMKYAKLAKHSGAVIVNSLAREPILLVESEDSA